MKWCICEAPLFQHTFTPPFLVRFTDAALSQVWHQTSVAMCSSRWPKDYHQNGEVRGIDQVSHFQLAIESKVSDPIEGIGRGTIKIAPIQLIQTHSQRERRKFKKILTFGWDSEDTVWLPSQLRNPICSRHIFEVPQSSSHCGFQRGWNDQRIRSLTSDCLAPRYSDFSGILNN